MKLNTISLTAVATFELLSLTAAQQSGAIRRRAVVQAQPPVPVVKPDALTALIDTTSTSSEVFGVSALRYSGDGAALLSVDITGLDAASGSAVITEGTSCNSTSSDFSEIPSLCANGSSSAIEIDTLRQSGADSVSRSAQRVDNGCNAAENEGKTVLIYDGLDSTTSTVVGCGIFIPEVKKKLLKAKMKNYPGYSGNLSPRGKVVVKFNADNTFTFKFGLSGLLPNCVDCGIHIHKGTSCDSHAQVMGHGWNSLAVRDLWFSSQGAVYNTDANGVATGYFTLTNGFNYEANVNHAVVIHTAGGARVGCGILK